MAQGLAEIGTVTDLNEERARDGIGSVLTACGRLRHVKIRFRLNVFAAPSWRVEGWLAIRRKRDGEDRSLAEGAGCTHGSAMGFRDFFHNRESEARSA